MFGGFANKINLKNHLLPYLYHAGDNRYFAAGDGIINFHTNLKLVDNNSWSKISSGGGISFPFTLAIKNGELWAWGSNREGQLGDGTKTDRRSPIRIGNDSDWQDVSVSLSGLYSLAIKSGKLYAWGNNSHGQLGIGNLTSISSPVQVGLEEDWFMISAGSGLLNTFSLGIRNTTVSPPSAGTLFAWGNNDFGQLGTGNLIGTSSPVQVGLEADWFHVAAGRIHSIGLRSVIALDLALAGGSGIVHFGRLYAWGDDSLGQTGHGIETINWNVDPARSNQSWWYWWWWNNNGPRNIFYISSPVQIGTDFDWMCVDASENQSIAIKFENGGYDLHWRGDGIGNTVIASGVYPGGVTGNQLKVASCGQNGVTFIKNWIEPKGLYTVGANSFGQLGNGTIQDSFVSTPYRVDASTDYTQVASGNEYFLAIKNNETYGLGYDHLGLTMQNLSSSYARNFLSKIDSTKNRFNYIATNYRANFGIINGELWAWGRNTLGCLGVSTAVESSSFNAEVLNPPNINPVNFVNSPVRVGNDVGWTMVQTSRNFHTLGIKNGELYGWGSNNVGQLGLSNSVSAYSSPVRVGTENTWTNISCSGVLFTNECASFAIREGRLFFFGNNSNFITGGSRSSPVQIGTLSDWTHVSAGPYHVLAIRDGKLYSWGQNSFGQLGINQTGTRSSPVQIGTESGWTLISAGDVTSVGIRDGKLFAWGRNTSGQLGDGTTSNRSSPVQIGSNTDWKWASTGGYGLQSLGRTVAIRNGELYAWGSNRNSDNELVGTLGDGTTVNSVSSPVRIGTFSDWIMAVVSEDATLAIR